MKLRLLAAVVLTLSSTPLFVSSANADWDYVYGNPGPADYSRYQAVKLDPTGGAFLVGFFSGSFEGNSSPASYKSFLQYRGSDGVSKWTTVLTDRGTSLPPAPDLVVDESGTAFVSTCSGADTAYGPAGCDDWTFDRSGLQLGFQHRPVGFESTPTVDSEGGFIRLSRENNFAGSGLYALDKLSLTLATLWTRSINQFQTGSSISSLRVSTDSDGGTWIAGDIPRPLPTQRDALALLHFDGDGNAINSILHYGYTLSFRGYPQPHQQQSFVTANRDFFWLNVGYDNVDYAPAYLHTVAFRVTDGALLGPVTGPISKLDGTPCLVCGGYNLPYILLPTSGVVGGGRRLVSPANGFLEVHDILGVTAVTSSLVKKIPIVGGIDGQPVYDADDFGNIVIAGATTSNVVFSTATTASSALRIEAANSPRAFLARNPGGRVPLKLTPNVPLEVKVTGVNDVPVSGVSAVSLNVTVTESSGPGFITVYPCGDRKLVSSLNYTSGQTVPNAVIAPVSESGTVCFYTTQATHILADVNGWFAVGSAFTALNPTRVFDTRPGQAASQDVARHTIGGPANILEVTLAGVAGVPVSGATAVSLNVTVTEPAASGFLTVFPCGTREVVSSINFVTGQTVPNAVMAPLSPNGTVCVYSNVDTHVLADVNGWFAAGAGFTALSPTRLFDTRPGQPAFTDIARQTIGGTRILEIQVAGAAGVPTSGVPAVSMNVTVDGPAADGFVTVFPCNQRALVSSLNFTTGQTIANAVIAPLSPSGTVCFYASVDTNILADVNGWFAPGGGFTTVSPNRMFDTR